MPTFHTINQRISNRHKMNKGNEQMSACIKLYHYPFQSLFRGLVKCKIDQPVLENHVIDQFVSQHEKLSLANMLEILELCVSHSLYCPDLLPIIAATLIEDEGAGIRMKLEAMKR